MPYYVKKGDEKIGPLILSELKALIDKDDAPNDVLVARSEDGEYLPIYQIQELQPKIGEDQIADASTPQTPAETKAEEGAATAPPAPTIPGESSTPISSFLLKLGLVAAVGFALIFIFTRAERSIDDKNTAAGKTENKAYHQHLGVSADGQKTSLADFEDSYVWVDYSAPWCAPCRMQAEVIFSLEHEDISDTAFLTVLVSDYRGGASRSTARKWAEKYRLDPEMVIAEEGRTTMGGSAIPEHALYSPTGVLLYRQVGYHTASQIKEVISRFKSK